MLVMLASLIRFYQQKHFIIYAQHQGYTKSGTPVRVQLLGSSLEWMAENSVRVIKLGSHGIDSNCECVNGL